MSARRLCALCAGSVSFVLAAASPVQASDKDWCGWGGPNHDFSVREARLADQWPAGGPRKLWTHALAGGYAAIPVADGVAYVFGREGDEEVIRALNASTGEKSWEYRYAAAIPKDRPENKGFAEDFGYGPNCMPLVLDDCVVTIGHLSNMHCLDRQGKVMWKHDLLSEFGGSHLVFGYSASPLHYKDMVITLVGGKGAAVVAFDAKTGDVRWKKHDYDISYGTARMMKLSGHDVLVTQVLDHVLALDPDNGEQLWEAPRQFQYHHNAQTPVLCGDDQVFVGTSGKDNSSVLYKLAWKDGKVTGQQSWTSKVRLVHQNCLSIGDRLLTSRGEPATVLCVKLSDGSIDWQDRAFGHTNFVHAADKFLGLSEDGTLRLLKLKGDGVEVLASADLLGDRSWAPPTLIGSVAYVRDREQAMAVELAAPATAAR